MSDRDDTRNTTHATVRLLIETDAEQREIDGRCNRFGKVRKIQSKPPRVFIVHFENADQADAARKALDGESRIQSGTFVKASFMPVGSFRSESLLQNI